MRERVECAIPVVAGVDPEARSDRIDGDERDADGGCEGLHGFRLAQRKTPQDNLRGLFL